MARKGRKGKEFSPKKDASGTIPVPDFPQKLFNLSWGITNKCWGGWGLSKSWRSVSKQCNSNGKPPRLQLSCNMIGVQDHGKSQSHRIQKVPFLPDLWTSICRSEFPAWTHVGPFSDWSLIPGIFSSELVTSSSCPIPIDFPFCSVMVLTGLHRPALLFLRPLHRPLVWVELQRSPIDPHDPEKQPMIFTNAIGYKGKFYALSLHGALAVVEEDDSSFRITGFGKNRAVPSVPSRHFIEYLIESDGEILLVFLISSKKSISIIDYVEVFKLDLVTLSWIKIDSLGDNILFLGIKRSLSITANQVGYKPNHVYFTHQAINCWMEFDMKSGSIAPCCNL